MPPEQIIAYAIAQFEKPLVSYAKNITGDLESARDAVQETFLRLSRQNLPRLQPRLAPWLYCVCRNCALDHRRRSNRYTDPVDEDHIPADGNPLHHAIAEEDKKKLASLVATLPARQQELLKLKFEGDLTYKEMGAVMKMSISHIGVQLHETIQNLRKLWKSDLPFPEQPAP
jgi:RNA polymerase sigma-70 factor (ECF subfamily)